MRSRLTRHAALVAAAIDKSAVRVERRHATAWTVLFRNGAELPVRVELADDWLLFDAAMPSPTPDLWSLMMRNASLPAGLKLVMTDTAASADPPVRLRADVLLEDEADPTARVLDACTAIKAIAHVWDTASETSATDASARAIAPAGVTALCHDTGWPLVERDGRAFVELDVLGSFVQARVEPRREGGVMAAVPIGEDVAPPSARSALALLLLRTSSAVRLARAAADDTARFEVALAAPVNAAMLQHAFAALSVAYRMAGREAAILARDEFIATAYLQHCGHLVMAAEASTITHP